MMGTLKDQDPSILSYVRVIYLIIILISSLKFLIINQWLGDIAPSCIATGKLYNLIIIIIIM